MKVEKGKVYFDYLAGYYWDINQNCFFNEETKKKLQKAPKDFLYGLGIEQTRDPSEENIYLTFFLEGHYLRSTKTLLYVDLISNFIKSRNLNITIFYWSRRWLFEVDRGKELKEIFIFLETIPSGEDFCKSEFLKWQKRYHLEQLLPNNYPFLKKELFFDFGKRLKDNQKNKQTVDFFINCLKDPFINTFLLSQEKDSSHYTMAFFRPLYQACAEMGIPLPKKDIYRKSIEIMKNYKIWKEQKNKEFFTDYIMKKSYLEFEDDEFCIILPKNENAMFLEGYCQHNCVYSVYLEKFLNKETNIVFMRSKNNLDKSLITIEISNNNVLKQALMSYNKNIPIGSEYEKFLLKYKEYLDNLPQL